MTLAASSPAASSPAPSTRLGSQTYRGHPVARCSNRDRWQGSMARTSERQRLYGSV